MSVQFIPQASAKSKTYELPIKLTPCQKVIDQNPARFKLIRAGRKFGKSTLAEFRCIKKLGTPNSRVWFCGPTYRQSKLIAWEDFKRLIPREALAKKPNETDLIITLKNGSQLFVMGSDNPDSLRGPAPDHVALEEFAMMQPEAWHEVIRPNLMPKKGTADFISTPRGYNWMKDLEDAALKPENSDEWAVFHYTVYDNPHIDEAEIQQSKMGCFGNEKVWNQEYMARYESSVGRVFSSFSVDTHCKYFVMPKHKFTAYRAVDYGMRDNLACLWGKIEGRNLHIYREHVQNDTPASVQAHLIQGKTTSIEDIDKNAISHDAAKQDAELKGLTVKWHFENAGMRPMYLSSRDKQSSREMIQQLIQEERLFIDPVACPVLVKQMLKYEWKDTLIEKTMDGNDDAVDALHYLVELLQYDLYLHQTKEEIDTPEKIRAELLAQRTSPRKWKIERRDELAAFEFADSQAGYLE
jgi:hypothetical protein